ncbi:MAG: DNA polymerase III subunit gamma/tau [Saprospiraceae bacterium]|jgi:DNA polymerase-3 subunit gamma/tau
MSNYVVSARKYRPVRFDEVVGQEHITQTLKKALVSNHLAHAFLFCGPRGVGKTTCARILARVINCENPGEDKEPCNQCNSCLSFNTNSSFNIIELDAASNNTVDHIKGLVEQVRFQPQKGRYKVFIIDEVHMLSSSAFNAFLKTLEEPPAHAIFILATTERHKILPTILSRCQIYDFKRIEPEKMVGHLNGICQREGIEVENDALHIIAQKSDGALRDALSIFDRLVAFGGNRLLYKDAVEQLNILDYDYFFKAAEFMMLGDVADLLLLFDEVIQNGFEPDLFINGLAGHFRDLLMAKVPETIPLLDVGDQLKKRYKEQAEITPESFILSGIEISNSCDLSYKAAKNRRLHVELALIKMCYVNRDFEIPEKKNETGIEKPSSSVVKKPQSVKKSNHLVAEPLTPSPNMESGIKKMPKLKSIDQMAEEIINTEEKEKLISFPEFNIENLKSFWSKYVEEVNQDGIKPLLRNTELRIEKNNVIAETGTSLGEAALKAEIGLMEGLRTFFGKKDLMMKVVINKKNKRIIKKVPKPLSNKEKYEILLAKYPLVETLQQTFELNFDDN